MKLWAWNRQNGQAGIAWQASGYIDISYLNSGT